MKQQELCLRIELVIDCQSIFDALATDTVRTPVEATFVLLLHSFKEQLLSNHLYRLWWVDTHDMLADGLNKGVCSRTALAQAALHGHWTLVSPTKVHFENTQVTIKSMTASLQD